MLALMKVITTYAQNCDLTVRKHRITEKYEEETMKKWKRAFAVLAMIKVMIVSMSVTAFAAVDDIFTVADKIIRDVYSHIAGISTVLAGLMSAIAVIGAKMSNNQHKVDQSWDWLKRIWIAWAVINGIGAFIAYVVPLFNGYAVLP